MEEIKKYHRRSIRLKGYDYSQGGLYFITICTHNHKHLFGEIVNGKMILNNAGKHANECWLEIPNHFPNTMLHEHVIMPNHVHSIIEIITVGAKNLLPHNDEMHNGANNHSPLPSRPCGTSKTVGSIVRGYKIGVTKWFRKNLNDQWPINKQVWQRNYWEHIIRDEKSYYKICDYILNNPLNWQNDKLNGGNGSIVMESSANYNFEQWMV